MGEGNGSSLGSEVPRESSSIMAEEWTVSILSPLQRLTRPICTVCQNRDEWPVASLASRPHALHCGLSEAALLAVGCFQSRVPSKGVWAACEC